MCILQFSCAVGEMVLTQKSVLEINHVTLKTIISSDDLKANETTILDLLDRWSEKECQRKNLEPTLENKREVLGEVLYDVRLASMTPADLSKEPARCGLLTDKELRTLLLGSSQTDGITDSTKFSSRPLRSFQVYECKRCSSPGGIAVVGVGQPTRETFTLDFYTDKPVILFGIGVYGSSKQPSDIEVSINICARSQPDLTLSHTTTQMSTNGDHSVYRVDLSEPLQIRKNTTYTIALCTTSARGTWKGSLCQNKVNVHGTTFTFGTFGAGITRSGQALQIPSIYFL